MITAKINFLYGHEFQAIYPTALETLKTMCKLSKYEQWNKQLLTSKQVTFTVPF